MGFAEAQEEALTLISHSVKSELAAIFNDYTLPNIMVSMEVKGLACCEFVGRAWWCILPAHSRTLFVGRPRISNDVRRNMNIFVQNSLPVYGMASATWDRLSIHTELVDGSIHILFSHHHFLVSTTSGNDFNTVWISFLGWEDWRGCEGLDLAYDTTGGSDIEPAVFVVVRIIDWIVVVAVIQRISKTVEENLVSKS
jgi:hypothetical protein